MGKIVKKEVVPIGAIIWACNTSGHIVGKWTCVKESELGIWKYEDKAS